MAAFDNTPPESSPVGIEPWAPCKARYDGSSTAPTTVKDGDIVDGVTLATGDRFLSTGAVASSGIYTVGASSSARAADADTSAEFTFPRTVHVTGGNLYSGCWRFETDDPFTLGTTVPAFTQTTAGTSAISGASAFSNTQPGTVTI